MSEPGDATRPLTRARMIIATLIVIATIVIVWRVIEYRMQPPPPPHKVGEGLK